MVRAVFAAPLQNPARISFWAALAVVLAGLSTPVLAQQGGWTGSAFAGNLTSNNFEEVFNPGAIDFVDSQLVGVALGYEAPLANDRWTVGAELQLVRHFGIQQHWEVNLPVILRYHPARPWPRSLESLALGVGGSYATRIPQVEINNDGASRRALIYWLAEVEFATRRPGDTVFLRLHHRSNAFGLLEPDAGSNAIVLGFRRTF